MNESEPTTEVDPERSKCADGIIALQRMLDGDRIWDTSEAAIHRAICVACREELALAGSLNRLSSDVVVPARLGERVVETALRSRRLRSYGRFASGAVAIAVCVLVAVFAFRKNEVPDSSTAPIPVAILPTPKSDPLPKVEPKKPLGESMAEARQALVKLSRRPANETKDQFNWLMPDPKLLDANNPSDGFEPLADVRTGAGRSVEPVQNSAKRAFNFLIRAADPPDRRQ